MSRSRRTPEQPEVGPTQLIVPRAQFENELDERIALGQDLLGRQIGTREEFDGASSDYYTWSEYNREFLRRRFTTNEIADEYSYFGAGAFPMDPTLAQRVEEYRDDVREKLRRLDSIKKRIPLFEESPQARPATRAAVRDEAAAIESIFIVHGHDEALKLAVHGFVRDVTDVNVVILHNEANRGRTVLEKFEAVGSRAGFAIVLLTADDVGGAAADAAELKPRARQNVIWEFGFFAGALGRSHVAVLYAEGVELPSDLHGLAYIPYDFGGGWRLLLAKELKEAGVAVDTSKLI
jgi:predicted nucleotide-binding protein